MAETAGTQQRRIHFRGRVQGVGFRYTTRRIAQRFAVTGYVQNLPDGQVLLIVEGEQEEVDSFVAAVRQAMRSYIRGVTSDILPASGNFAGFEIRQ